METAFSRVSQQRFLMSVSVCDARGLLPQTNIIVHPEKNGALFVLRLEALTDDTHHLINQIFSDENNDEGRIGS